MKFIILLILLAGCIQNSQLSNEEIKELETVISNLITLQSGQQVNVKYKNQGVKSGLIEVNFTISQGTISQDISIYLTQDKKYIAYFLQDYQQLKELTSFNKTSETKELDYPDFLDKKMALGNTNANIILIEFSDYECPFCARFESETLPLIKSDWIDKGKVVMYYAHYPLPIHPKAIPAALASYCAEQQNKFWEYSNSIFKNINKLNSDEDYVKLAQELNLDTDKFRNCLKTTDKSFYYPEFQYGSSIGITGTPGFLVISKQASLEKVKKAASYVQGSVAKFGNYYGIVFSGAYPYTQFNLMLKELE
jgi:predicted DsbA family dithiol-disulfide isomerase